MTSFCFCALLKLMVDMTTIKIKENIGYDKNDHLRPNSP